MQIKIKLLILVRTHRQDQLQAKKLKVSSKLYRKIIIIKAEKRAKPRMG